MATPSRVEHRIELYTQEPMVNWLAPGQLLKTGIRAAIATTVGGFSDPREVQGALHPTVGNPPLAIERGGPVWIDYVADTGDGWDSTYSVAWSVSRDTLTVPTVSSSLPRADVLILGGDQVYPTPVGNGYRTHFVDPFRAAFPADVPAEPNPDTAPLLVALPGNHDWYDGLHGFKQLFCNRQDLGRWRTGQRTSYFGVRLPHGWWLWGLDLQLGSEIDRPQLDYFVNMARQLRPGERIIICTPEPSWLNESERLEHSRSVREDEARGSYYKVARWLRGVETQTPRFSSLRLIEELIAPHGAELAAVLAGDLHHYALYQPEPGCAAPLRVTCGGGGAYLLGTHDLPATLRFRCNSSEQRYTRAATYPDASTSRRLRNQALKLPLRNPLFCAQLATLYLVYLWVLQSASKVPIAALDRLTLMEYLAYVPFTLKNFCVTLPATVFKVLAHSPASVLLTLGILGGAAAFTAANVKQGRRWATLAGALHGFVHLTLALLLLWAIGQFNLGWLAERLGYAPAEFLDHAAQVLLFCVQAITVGGVVGGLLFGGWMVLVNSLFGWHGEEVFSSQSIVGYKSFLRMRVDASGLTIYPLKIETICKRWRIGRGIQMLLRAGRTWRLRTLAGNGARFEPEQPIAVELIQPPLHIPTRPQRATEKP